MKPAEDMATTYRAGEKIDDPLVIGYEFCATMQLRTPLVVLRLHGATIPPEADIPSIDEPWHGIWAPVIAPLLPGMPLFEQSRLRSSEHALT